MQIRKEDFPYIRLFVFVAGFLMIFSSITDMINIYDEGVSILGAINVSSGNIPYKDFWTIYAPGQFYLLSSLIEIVGNNLFIIRLVSILADFAVCMMVYLLAAKIFSKNFALLSFIISVIWFMAMPMFGRAVTYGILSVLISNYFLFLFFEKNDKKFLVLAGVMIGIASLFRHEMAGYIYGAEFWAVFFSGMPNKNESSEPLRTRIIKGFLNGVIFTLGVLLIFLPVALYFISVVDINILYENLIKFPILTFREYRSLPLPNPLNIFEVGISVFRKILLFWEGIIYYLPLISFGLTAYFLYWRVRKKKLKLNGEIFWKEMLLFNIGLNFYNQAMIRSDIEHLVPAFIIFSILFLSLILIIPYPNIRKLLFIVTTLFVIMLPISRKVQNTNLLLSSSGSRLSSTKANFIYGKKDEVDTYNLLIDYIKKNTKNSEVIYSGNTKHDKLISNDLMIYYLSDRKSISKYYESHPGITTTNVVQNHIINELKDKNVKLLVLLNQENIIEPNKSAESSNVYELDNFIKSNYSKEIIFGNYEIWKKLK